MQEGNDNPVVFKEAAVSRRTESPMFNFNFCRTCLQGVYWGHIIDRCLSRDADRLTISTLACDTVARSFLFIEVAMLFIQSEYNLINL